MSVRGSWQLQKLTVHFCRGSGDSAGARTFIKDVLPQFAESNPWLNIQVVNRATKSPTLTAEYKDGTSKVIGVRMQDAKAILETAQKLRDSSTATVRNLAKPVITPRPSVQGVWGPDVAFPAFSLRESKPAAMQ